MLSVQVGRDGQPAIENVPNCPPIYLNDVTLNTYGVLFTYATWVSYRGNVVCRDLALGSV